MRSFMKCMSCCCVTPEGSLSEEVLKAATPPRTKETKFVIPSDHMVAPTRKKNRVRVRISGSMNQQWKPSLFSITEDKIVAEKREETTPEATSTVVDRVRKRNSSGGSRSKVHVRSNSNDMGPKPVPLMTLPTFAPTPFMF